LLPAKMPDKAIQEAARAMLRVKGVAQAKPVTTPRLPRSRR
jgi:hypothetical protein